MQAFVVANLRESYAALSQAEHDLLEAEAAGERTRLLIGFDACALCMPWLARCVLYLRTWHMGGSGASRKFTTQVSST